MNSLIDVDSTIIFSYEQRPEKLELYKEFFKLSEKVFTSEILSEIQSPYGNSVFLIKMKKR